MNNDRARLLADAYHRIGPDADQDVLGVDERADQAWHLGCP